jgi:Protein of unknown function (DUF3179)
VERSRLETSVSPVYALPQFKGILYSLIDPRMQNFFPPHVPARIRLDEVEWGGVQVNGIPPLVRPDAIAAKDAKYLADSDRVFGIEVHGQARAYPQRILAWHEWRSISWAGWI